MDRAVKGAIDTIYDAVLSPQGFADVPDQIAAATDARAVNIWCVTTDIEVVQAQNCGTDARAVDEYLNNWIDNDPVYRTALGDGLGRCVTAEELLGDRYMSLPVYEGFYRPNGLARQMGRFDRVESAWVGGLSIQRSDSDRDFGIRERGLVECFSGHLRQALRLGLRLETASMLGAAFENTLDRCRVPVMVCDLQGKLLWANCAGQRRLHGNDIRIAAKGDQVSFKDMTVQARFRAGRGEMARGRRVPVEIPLAATASQSREWCVVAPVAREFPISRDRQPLLAMTFHDGDAVPPIDTHRLAHILDITPSESRTLAGLMRGNNLVQIAETQGKMLSTVRSQVKSMNIKLKCHSQAELVALAWARSSRIAVVN